MVAEEYLIIAAFLYTIMKFILRQSDNFQANAYIQARLYKFINKFLPLRLYT